MGFKNRTKRDISSSDTDESKFNVNESDDESRLVAVQKSSPRATVDAPGQKYHSNLFVEELTSDDEIFTFQCPGNFKIESLLNKRLNLKKRTKFADDAGCEFQCQVLDNDVDVLTCVVPSENHSEAKFVKLPVAGHLVIQKQVNVGSKGCAAIDLSEEIEFPSDFKNRHPLLGLDWEDHLSTARYMLKKSKRARKRSQKLKHKLFEAEMKKKNEHLSKALSIKRKKH